MRLHNQQKSNSSVAPTLLDTKVGAAKNDDPA